MSVTVMTTVASEFDPASATNSGDRTARLDLQNNPPDHFTLFQGAECFGGLFRALSGQQDAKNEALKSGAQDFLLKPIDQDALFDILDHYAGHRNLLPKTPLSLA